MSKPESGKRVRLAIAGVGIAYLGMRRRSRNAYTMSQIRGAAA